MSACIHAQRAENLDLYHVETAPEVVENPEPIAERGPMIVECRVCKRWWLA